MKISSHTGLKALSLLTLSIALAACNQAATPQSQAQSPRPAAHLKLADNAAPRQYFVELSGDPTDLSAQSVGSQQAGFRAQAKAQGIQYQELKSYSLLFNGFVVAADTTAKRQIERLGGVVAVYPVQQIQMPQTQAIQASAEPQMFTARGMTGADIANNELGLTGKGIKVGIIDSGIDVDHPAFKNRIIKQHDFVGDAYNANDPQKSTPVPDESADDCGGHGTHVSGIVGGNDPSTGFKGVAPEVVFGAYKVFGCEGSVNDPVVMDAMEMAVRDGMQVINMSLGSGYDWAESPLARAASRVVKRGVVMVNSQGNEGDNGQFSSGSPAAGDQVISVGSVANVAFRLPKAVLSDGTEIGYTNNNDGHDAPLSGSIEVVKGPKSSPTATEDGCTSSGGYAPNSLTGKLVLIRRGTCSFYEKAFNAQKAGAAIVLIYNRLPEHLDGVGLTGDPAITVPVISISGVLGAKIDAAIGKGKTTLTWTKDTISIANPAGNTNSTFSSIGATPTLTFKPEVSAPGGSIYSTYPLSKTAVGYQTLSGTSMSSPHVAGAVALLLQAHPGMAAKDVVTLLQNTANPVSLRFNSTTYDGLLNYVQQQGAGMIDIPAAATTQVIATPSKLELGESQTFPTRLKVVVLKNSSSKAVTYTVYHYPALTLYGDTYTVQPDDENVATMTVNGQSVDGESTVDVTVPAGGQTELNLAITAPAGADDLSQYGGYLMLDSKNGGGHLSVPYMGFKGDYQAIPILTDAYIGDTKVKFPVLIQRDAAGDQDFAPDKPVYTLADIKPGKPDQPYAFVHFNHQARRANLDVLNANGSLAAELDRDQYLPRNAKDHFAAAEDDVWFAFSWDGKGTDGKSLLPNGDYKLRLRVLKPLGDESNPADWETWVSPAFGIKHN
ncbi:S8 family serine peptidase [Deinococcus alpinitundrae]|uniref:S8 family serine peptidase n=1 Tax=Deinococcus alpinitundrae TaxID=468913 RepID=UPI001ED8E34E|nr:S8 family serine peptidase [Deinococcus alpinitundrae]